MRRQGTRKYLCSEGIRTLTIIISYIMLQIWLKNLMFFLIQIGCSPTEPRATRANLVSKINPFGSDTQTVFSNFQTWEDLRNDTI